MTHVITPYVSIECFTPCCVPFSPYRRCSEIILRPYQFCNLTEVVVRDSDDVASLQRKARLAAILGTFQASLVDFPYLRDIWRHNTAEVSMQLGFQGALGRGVKTDKHPDTLLPAAVPHMTHTRCSQNSARGSLRNPLPQTLSQPSHEDTKDTQTYTKPQPSCLFAGASAGCEPDWHHGQPADERPAGHGHTGARTHTNQGRSNQGAGRRPQ